MVCDYDAMVFNLTHCTFFNIKNYRKAITRCKSKGPYFGDSELLTKEPFNGNNNCCSYVNLNGYNITMDSESKNNLTNIKCFKQDSL